VRLPARFKTPQADHRVLLEDISASGARIRVQQAHPLVPGTLHWLGKSVCAELVWHRGALAGLTFDVPIEAEWLEETAKLARMAQNDPHGSATGLAAAWAYGPEDW
jgi:hypothetical protein